MVSFEKPSVTDSIWSLYVSRYSASALGTDSPVMSERSSEGEISRITAAEGSEKSREGELGSDADTDTVHSALISIIAAKKKDRAEMCFFVII